LKHLDVLYLLNFWNTALLEKSKYCSILFGTFVMNQNNASFIRNARWCCVPCMRQWRNSLRFSKKTKLMASQRWDRVTTYSLAQRLLELCAHKSKVVLQNIFLEGMRKSYKRSYSKHYHLFAIWTFCSRITMRQDLQ